MGYLGQVDAKLYQTRYGTVFHVEPMALREPFQGWILGVQRRYEQLGRKVDNLQ
jgi:hypothetical protein